MIMNADEPDDYVVATGETHSVREFLEKTFSYLDLDWENMSRSIRVISVRPKSICCWVTRAKFVTSSAGNPE